MQEFNLLFEPLMMLATEPRTGVLFVLLVIAAVTDYRSYKIPNWLTAGGTAFALIYNTVVPFSLHAGFLWGLGGFVLGFLVMLPLYALGVMGAGDVKLMAMVGAFLGVSDTFNAVIATFIVGGVAALVFALFNQALARMLGNVKSVAQAMLMSAIGGFRPDARIEASQSVGKLPYGVSISMGTMGYVVARQLGYA